MSHQPALRRLGSAVLSLLVLVPVLVCALTVAVTTAPADAGRAAPHPPRPAPQPVPLARPVPRDTCRHVDPNLVHGSCLRYDAGGASRLTWIGSYRAPTGRTFFCIDYLYSSRLPRQARIVSTRGLVNQLGAHVGRAEVAALNAVVSRWAAHGSTGSDVRDAAIALLAREVMGDGVQPGGTVVYPRWLHVGHAVRSPLGGVSPPVLAAARHMWAAASRERGPYTLSLASSHRRLLLGQARRYRLVVRSASGHAVPGLPVHLTCTGPISCPAIVRSAASPVGLSVRPRDVGRFRITAVADVPAADGHLYVAPHWSTHAGTTAASAGVQRGWIAGASTARASAAAGATIDKAKPRITTRTSDQLALAGSKIHDTVVVDDLPDDYQHSVAARLYGPFGARPGADDCRPRRLAGQVRFLVTHDGTYTTPTVRVGRPGYYVWQETLPGDRFTTAVTTRCGVASETTQVHRLTPKVSTTVSHQRVVVGGSLRDTVRVSGIQHQPVTVTWRLLGPLPAHGTSCTRLRWRTAPERAHGSLRFTGSGTRTTAATTVSAAGCYTYAERIAATDTTAGAHSVAGLVSETSLAQRLTPRVSTVVSHQRAVVGDRIHDTVEVSGVRDQPVTVAWRLLGPVAAHDGACTGLGWQHAPERAHGTLAFPGNGTRTTGDVTLDAGGCYTYAETIAATDTTGPAHSEPGLVTETSLVRRLVPHVSTQVSRQQAVVGASLHDTVVVSGIDDERVEVHWRLLGPVTPRNGSCSGLTWTQAPTRSHGTTVASGDGRVTTRPVPVRAAGCYTYAESIPATPTTDAASSPPGLRTETALVTRHVPTVSTQVSHQRVTVGEPLRDTVRVGGIADEHVVVHWRLLGPVDPQHGSCRGLAWARARVAGSGTLGFHGSGTHTTGPTVVSAAGCYTYAERIPATSTTTAAESAPGQVSETSLASRRHVQVHTTVSARRATVGDLLHDSIRVDGVQPGDEAVVQWRLLGPKAPRDDACTDLRWHDVPVVAHGSLTARSSAQSTPAVRITDPGCYTFAATVPTTPRTFMATSPPGQAAETSLVRRAALRVVPVVPSGLGAPGPRSTDPRFYAAPRRLVHASAGGRLVVPSVGIDAPVDSVGLDRSVFAIPGDTHHVGWLTASAGPGDVMGASVLAGHVSDRHDRPGALWSLRGVKVGARVVWRDDRGAAHEFRVTRLARYSRAHRLPAAVFAVSGRHVLHLVTCTDRHATAGGHFHYADNLVVTAVPVSAP